MCAKCNNPQDCTQSGDASFLSKAEGSGSGQEVPKWADALTI